MAENTANPAQTPPAAPPKEHYRVKFAQFNLRDLTTSFLEGQVHAAEKFGDELVTLIELGAIERVVPKQK